MATSPVPHREHRSRAPGRTALAFVGPLAAFLAMAATARAAVNCPYTNGGHGLTAFSLFEGDPADLADLAPDSSRRGAAGTYTNVWRLGPAARLVAVCRYGGGGERRIRLPPGLTRCQSDGAPGRLRAVCE